MKNKNILIVLVLAVAASACATSTGKDSSVKPENSPSSTTAAKSAENPKPVVGDTVVARWSGNSFYEGKVETLDGSRYRIKWSDNSSPSDVDSVDVYPLPKDGVAVDVKVGDYVLAKLSSGTSWTGAEVSNVETGVVTVKAAQGGSTSSLPPEKIIKISAATAANFKQQASQTDFMAHAQTLRPQAPAGFAPRKGERVVAEWSTNSWYGGRVQKIAGSKATVAWDDQSKPTELDFAKVFPYPTGSNYQTPSVDGYLIVKPNGNGKWGYAQVTGLNGKAIEIKTADGQTRSITAGEYINLK